MIYFILIGCSTLLAASVWFMWWEHKERGSKKWHVATQRIERKPQPQVKTIFSTYLTKETDD